MIFESINILLSICEYLSLEDLSEICQVSKAFNKISKSPNLWKSHCMSVFFGDLSLFGEIIPSDLSLKTQEFVDYYSLLKLRSQIHTFWTKLKIEFTQQENLDELKQEIFSALKEPLLPMPSLRREYNYFPTIIQDLIGNSFLPSSPFELPFSCPALDSLEKNLSDLEENFMESGHNNSLTLLRWMLRTKKDTPLSRDSLASQSTSADSEKPNVLISLVKAIKHTVKAHCKAVNGYLAGCRDYLSFLSTYCMLWEAFSASIHRLDYVFVKLSKIINYIYDQKVNLSMKTPPYSIMRVMVIVWRRVVVEKFKDTIYEGVIRVISDLRKKAVEFVDLKNYDHDENALTVLAKIVQSTIDLSVNELSIHMINLSSFKCGGIYCDISDMVIKISNEFYDSCLCLPKAQMEKVLDFDLTLISRVFLNHTVKEVRKKNLQVKMKYLEKEYGIMYKLFSFSGGDNEPQPLVDTAFSKSLFMANPCLGAKKDIKVFINYLVNNKLGEDISKYNQFDFELDELLNEKSNEDEEIEFRLRNLGLDLNISNEESVLFSTDKDIDAGELFCIIAEKSS